MTLFRSTILVNGWLAGLYQYFPFQLCLLLLAGHQFSLTLSVRDRKSTRLNSSHTEIYTLSLHDALPIYHSGEWLAGGVISILSFSTVLITAGRPSVFINFISERSEEHTSELQSHRDLHSFPT